MTKILYPCPINTVLYVLLGLLVAMDLVVWGRQ